MRKLHPNLEKWLHAINAQQAAAYTVESARDGLAELTEQWITRAPEIAKVIDSQIKCATHSIPLRLYHPQPEKSLPVLVFFHGGGHVSGSVNHYDGIARKLTQASQHIVISVDYRLAPEHPYPNGLNDAYYVISHVEEILQQHNLNYTNLISIAGDSGGGAITASISAKAQFDPQVELQQQILIYPSLDYTLTLPSIEQNATGYLLHSDKISWYFDLYFQHDEDRGAASPLYQAITNKLPKTLLFTAEFCPLRDEGIAYAEQLTKVGVEVQHVHFDDQTHTFLNIEDLVPEACQQVYQTIGEVLNSAV